MGVLQAWLVGVAAGVVLLLYISARALRLRRVQGGGVALVALGHALRRRASGIELAARRVDGPLLESHRLVCSAGAGIRRLSRDLRGPGGKHERSPAQSVLRNPGVLEECSAAGARRCGLSGVCAGDQRGDAGLSVARYLLEGACLARS